jgi:hypothetical protein
MKLKPLMAATWTALTIGISCVVASPAMAEDMRCGSVPGANNYCRVDTSRGVELIHQHSAYACYYNDTWGYDSNGIWVANGCSATFRIGSRERKDNDDAAAIGLGILALGILGAVAADNDDGGHHSAPPPPPPGGYGPGYPPPPPPSHGGGYGGYEDDYEIISCNSKNNKYKYCPVRVRSHAELVRQRSRNSCRFNKTWGYDRRGVWVSKGCRADFAIYD